MNYAWYQSYETGIPHTIDVNQYSSIVDVIESSFQKFRNNESFYCMGKCYTYGELDILTRKFASYLQNDLKLQKGDRVALMMPNILQYPIALFGVLRAGMIAVNVNPLYTVRELEHQLKDSGAKAIVIFENSCHVLEKCLANTPIQHVLTTQIGDMLNFPKSMIVNLVIKKVKKMVPDWNIPSAKSFKTVLFNADASDYRRPELKLEDIAFLQYTGGTTGVSKGAVLTHKNIVANIIQAKAWIKNFIKEGEETIITPLPLYHIFSLTANCFVFATVGAKNILITNPRDMPGFIKEMKKHKFTAFTGVNTLFNGLMANPDFETVDFSSLRLTLGGGMAVQRSVAEKWKKVTGVPLIEAYGLTETSPAACINPMTLKDYNGKIGLPISSTEIVIKDDDGNDVPQGEVGEICIRGPQVMQGYWNRPEETANVMTSDGYFKTGDMGNMDENGFFQIVDRKKDMILVSGFNVYPNEVEEVVCSHPKVFECAAVGVPDEKSGELVKIFVVKKDESLTEEELRKFCKENFTGYKNPRFVEFRKELPKTNVGKILRRELRDAEIKRMKG
ncbi:MAG: long-chain-fatty-acid--CoA ligase [Bdellovibrio sp. CG12_big_fil_rev_8_21_14_0_65_39_13]|nr:MAG: long-chain-fatty-acid--CoA ligase [Bdellovibrio sp. CG22_combo_CG10-13_8_21_14_all_39_27]PIQ59836.1 MAG: long-chain-fatty-acid--CoA ligase [Bdellovibrio sp. CG12_big_fil_rev_8_21_14_0_65_39_13]PIR36136.1 MAG: long-chain-fatty-acid--CoA ligase [Bdellovibrio sp. CG11_big_fil_rev_8_21_14_0_20_39_38]